MPEQPEKWPRGAVWTLTHAHDAGQACGIRCGKCNLKRFYKPGSLRAGPAGVEITFVNPLAFCIIQGGDAVIVDGRVHPKEQTLLDNGEKQVGGVELSPTSYLKFAKGAEIRVMLQGLSLPAGAHRVQAALELRKMGWVELDVRDNL